MEGANLKRAHFEGAIFIGTKLTGANLDQSHFEGANLGSDILDKANFEGVNSSGLPYSKFPDNLRNRIGKESEFGGVKIGKLESADAQIIMDNITLKINGRANPPNFPDRITKAIERDTNIEEDAITGILTKEKADEIIERYNKTMKNVQKR